MGQHEALMAQYQALLGDLDNTSLSKQYQALKTEQEQLSAKYDTLKADYKVLVKTHEELKQCVRQTMVLERDTIIKRAQAQTHTYFPEAVRRKENELTHLEEQVKVRLGKLMREVHFLEGEEKKAYEAQIKSLEEAIKAAAERQYQVFLEQQEGILHDYDGKVVALEAAPLTETVQQARLQKPTFEMKFGLQLLSKFGMLMILLGIASGLQYTYQHFLTPELKGLLGYLLGAILLIGGYYFYQATQSELGAVLTGGGLATLYIATFWSCLVLHIIPMSVAFAMLLFVSGLAFVLATVYESKTIACFGLIGGYLPLYYYTFTGMAVSPMVSIVYLFIIYGVTFGIAYKRGWAILDYLSSICQLPVMVYVVVTSTSFGMPFVYISLWLMIYIASSLIYPLRYQQALQQGKIVLLTLNIVIAALASYGLFVMYEQTAYNGLLALLYGCLFTGIATLLKKYGPQEKSGITLFTLTALTFIILIIPFQLGVRWLVIGWLVEGAFILAYAKKLESPLITLGGGVLLLLSTVSLMLTTDLSVRAQGIGASDVQFAFYVVIVWGLIIKVRKDKDIALYRYVVPLQVVMYFATPLFGCYVLYRIAYLNNLYGGLLVPFAVWLGCGVALRCIKCLDGRMTRIVSQIYFSLAFVACIGLNAINVSWPIGIRIPFYTVCNVLAVAAFGFNVYEWTSKGRKARVVGSSLMLGVVLLLLTQCLYSQFWMRGIELVISGIYLLAAMGFIYYGFVKRTPVIRYVGLGVSVLTTAKLLLIDLGYYFQDLQIVAYFMFGTVMLLISYIYQRFAKRFEEELSAYVAMLQADKEVHDDKLSPNND